MEGCRLVCRKVVRYVGRPVNWKLTIGRVLATLSVRMKLGNYDNSDFDRGASRLVEGLWVLVKIVFFQNPLPWPSGVRVCWLRVFGARVGRGVVVRQGCNITFPWRLRVGNDVWIGEEVTILSLGQVVIESDVCISQQAYLCTGGHDHRSETFDLVVKPITVREGSWIAARAFVGPGVEVGAGALVAAGAVVVRHVPASCRVGGNPARLLDRKE